MDPSTDSITFCGFLDTGEIASKEEMSGTIQSEIERERERDYRCCLWSGDDRRWLACSQAGHIRPITNEEKWALSFSIIWRRHLNACTFTTMKCLLLSIVDFIIYRRAAASTKEGQPLSLLLCRDKIGLKSVCTWLLLFAFAATHLSVSLSRCCCVDGTLWLHNVTWSQISKLRRPSS